MTVVPQPNTLMTMPPAFHSKPMPRSYTFLSARIRFALLSLLATATVSYGARSACAEMAFQQITAFPTSAPGPWQPVTRLLEGGDGNFYGTTARGGLNDLGTVFKVTPAGAWTLLCSFAGTNGLYPRGGLVWGQDGNFYGTTSGTYSTNSGTLFRMTTGGVLNVIYTFQGTNGSTPYGELLQASNGVLYGTTFSSGAAGLGTAFGISTNGLLTTSVSFYGTNGCNPVAGLVAGDDGTFYGTTQYGGNNFTGAYTGNGTVFRLTTNGVLTTLVYFNGTNGSKPMAALVRGSDASFYGTTSSGGANGLGTVFRLTPDGALTTLVHLGPAGAVRPFGGLAEGYDGSFYGTTAYSLTNSTLTNGTVFKVTTNGVLTTLVNVDGTNGLHPVADLVPGGDGNLYGAMADATGSYSVNGGTIFRLVRPPCITSIVSSNGSTTLSWTAFNNGLYRVERSPTLGSAQWTAQPPTVTASGSNASFSEPTAATSECYYRIVLLP